MSQSPVSEVFIRVQSTPNPNAWKFVLDRPVLSEGKATYASPDEAKQNILASSLFDVAGVKQVHFFQNVITVTHSFDGESDEIQKNVCAVIQTRMPVHNPNQTKVDEKKMARESLSDDLRKIEEVLDRTIRPGLQGDGGDLTVVKYEDDQLYVHYEGACGTCPSSTSGTLMAIEGILRDEFNPKIEVFPV
ncbi:MAG: NifU family protein [Bdellovibrionales bacterium]|jgi:Fe-S cluster biogenesis protein NfuA|nr:NifU family protein [Bdellovibrionales bacterium]MBL7669172.1 NifU family protein [Pseudobdellovibrionaceae bacterium]